MLGGGGRGGSGGGAAAAGGSGRLVLLIVAGAVLFLFFAGNMVVQRLLEARGITPHTPTERMLYELTAKIDRLEQQLKLNLAAAGAAGPAAGGAAARPTYAVAEFEQQAARPPAAAGTIKPPESCALPGELAFPDMWRCPTMEKPWEPFNFHSQAREDRIIFDAFFSAPKPKMRGFFVEIGAFDGRTYSNTMMFEDHLDWRGVLIEAQPGNAKNLIKNSNRFKSAKLAMAVCPPGQRDLQMIGESDEVAGAREAMSKFQLDQFHTKSKTYSVRCAPLGVALRAAGLYKIDFFSLDVEGGELEVMETMDWSIPIYVLLAEMQGWNKTKEEKLRKLFAEHDLLPTPTPWKERCFKGEFCLNEVFINSKYFEQTKHFNEWDYWHDYGGRCPNAPPEAQVPSENEQAAQPAGNSPQ